MNNWRHVNSWCGRDTRFVLWKRIGLSTERGGRVGRGINNLHPMNRPNWENPLTKQLPPSRVFIPAVSLALCFAHLYSYVRIHSSASFCRQCYDTPYTYTFFCLFLRRPSLLPTDYSTIALHPHNLLRPKRLIKKKNWIKLQHRPTFPSSSLNARRLYNIWRVYTDGNLSVGIYDIMYIYSHFALFVMFTRVFCGH